MKEKTILSQNLKRLRKTYGITQEKIANMLGIKRSTYAYYEHGVNPGNDMIKKLADVFGMNPYYLVYEPLDENAKPHIINPDVPLILKDDKNVFRTPINEDAMSITFPQLSSDEKNLIYYMRLLNHGQKEKLCKEAEELANKHEQ